TQRAPPQQRAGVAAGAERNRCATGAAFSTRFYRADAVAASAALSTLPEGDQRATGQTARRFRPRSRAGARTGATASAAGATAAVTGRGLAERPRIAPLPLASGGAALIAVRADAGYAGAGIDQASSGSVATGAGGEPLTAPLRCVCDTAERMHP